MSKRGPDQYENDGYINREHLGSGTAASNNFLRGDHVWATVPSGSAAGSYNLIAAGTQTAATSGTVLFSNANGVTFGMANNSVVTASVQTNYLITAAASDHSHGNPTLALTNLSGTTASNSAGLTLSLSAAAPGAGGGVAVSAGAASASNGTIVFSNSNGVSFGMNGSTVTATVQTNYLTTAMASNRGSDFVQATAAFAGTSASGTIASNGISVSIGPYITTGMLSNAVTLSNIRVSGGTTSNLLSAITFGDANGVSFGLNAGTMTASHNALTTARASTDAIGLNTAQTNATWTVNSGGLSFNAGGYAGTGTSATNASITLGSNGLAISVAAPGGGGGFAAQGSGAYTQNTGTIQWANSNGITFGLSTNQMTASHNGLTTAAQSDHSHGNPTLALTNLTGTTASASNGLTISLSAAAPGGGATITQRYQWPPGNLTAVAAMGNGSFSINRIQADNNVSATRLDVPFYVSIASSANANTWGLRLTVFGAIYTKNVSTLSSLSSGSTAWSTSAASNSAGGTQIFPAAIRPLSIPMNVNMSIGEYYVGFGISTSTSSAGTATTALGNTWSVFGGPIYSSALGQVGDFTATTNTSTGLFGGQGVYSAAISTVPPAVSLSAIAQTGSYYARANIGLIFRNI